MAQEPVAEAVPVEAASLETAPGETPATAPPEDDARHREALERFDQAAALFERGDARGALAEMQAVYDLLEGRPDRYVVLYNFGRIYEALHRYDRATELYRRYLAESPADGADRADAEAALRVLERLLGTLVVRVNVAAEVWLGEDLVGQAPGEIALPAGVFALELRAAGYETVRREVELTARSRVEIDATLSRLSDVHGISPAFALASGGLALAALGVGVGLGVHVLSMRAGVDACAPRDLCGDPAAVSDTIALNALGADVSFGVAGLFSVTAVVLAFLTDWGGGAPPTSEQARVLPAVGTGSAGLVLHLTL